MSYPLLWVPDALRKRGIKVVEVKGWETRGRPYGFTPIGVMRHWTASPDTAGPAPALWICRDGRGGAHPVPGPLSHLLIARNLLVYMIAAGRANHAGAGGPFKTVPRDSGNTYFIGCEYEEDGRGEFPKDMAALADEIDAALLLGLKRTASWVIDHRAWAPTRKIDVRTLNMAVERQQVAALMQHKIIPRWPGVYLKRGMKPSPHVERFFRQLHKRYGWRFGRFSLGPAFGSWKARAVRRFQKARRLGVDGVVGPKTWRAAWK